MSEKHRLIEIVKQGNILKYSKIKQIHFLQKLEEKKFTLISHMASSRTSDLYIVKQQQNNLEENYVLKLQLSHETYKGQFKFIEMKHLVSVIDGFRCKACGIDVFILQQCRISLKEYLHNLGKENKKLETNEALDIILDLSLVFFELEYINLYDIELEDIFITKNNDIVFNDYIYQNDPYSIIRKYKGVNSSRKSANDPSLKVWNFPSLSVIIKQILNKTVDAKNIISQMKCLIDNSSFYECIQFYLKISYPIHLNGFSSTIQRYSKRIQTNKEYYKSSKYFNRSTVLIKYHELQILLYFYENKIPTQGRSIIDISKDLKSPDDKIINMLSEISKVFLICGERMQAIQFNEIAKAHQQLIDNKNIQLKFNSLEKDFKYFESFKLKFEYFSSTVLNNQQSLIMDAFDCLKRSFSQIGDYRWSDITYQNSLSFYNKRQNDYHLVAYSLLLMKSILYKFIIKNSSKLQQMSLLSPLLANFEDISNSSFQYDCDSLLFYKGNNQSLIIYGDQQWCLGSHQRFLIQASNINQLNLHMFSSIFPENKSEQVILLNSIAAIYYKLGLAKEAKNTTLKAIKIINQIELIENDSPSFTFFNISTYYKQIRDLKKAKRYLLLSIKYLSKFYGNNNHPHPQLIVRYIELGKIYLDLKKHTFGLLCMNEVYNILTLLSIGQQYPSILYHIDTFPNNFRKENKKIKDIELYNNHLEKNIEQNQSPLQKDELINIEPHFLKVNYTYQIQEGSRIQQIPKELEEEDKQQIFQNKFNDNQIVLKNFLNYELNIEIIDKGSVLAQKILSKYACKMNCCCLIHGRYFRKRLATIQRVTYYKQEYEGCEFQQIIENFMSQFYGFYENLSEIQEKIREIQDPQDNEKILNDICQGIEVLLQEEQSFSDFIVNKLPNIMTEQVLKHQKQLKDKKEIFQYKTLIKIIEFINIISSHIKQSELCLKVRKQEFVINPLKFINN